MRGYVPNPTGMNTRKSDRGWLERQEAARAKMSGASFDGTDTEWRDTDKIRQAAYAEKARLDQVEVARRREANMRLRVTCVCCGAGAIPVLQAERVLAAFDRSKVDEAAQIKAQEQRLTVACPICDGAQVDAEKGARIAAALAALPADYEPFDGHLQILYGIALAEVCHVPYSLRVAKGALWPRRAAPVTADDERGR